MASAVATSTTSSHPTTTTTTSSSSSNQRKKSTASAGDTDAGTIIGNYKVEVTIGQGTYGKVKLARNISTDEKVRFIF